MGDLNGDGRPDLAVANFSTNKVSLLLNTTTPGAATPTFTAKSDFTTGFLPFSVVMGDVNGDGRPDLAVANSFSLSTDVSLLLNTTAPGSMTPSCAPKADFTTGSGPRSATMGDVNGDGRLDLAVANYGSDTVSLLLNNTPVGSTTLSFAPKTDFAMGTGSAPTSVTMGDVNGDGRLDLAVANYGINVNKVSLLLNTTTPGATTPGFSTKSDFATGGRPVSVTMGDVTGDGKLDLAVAYISGGVSLLPNTTTAGATTPSFAAKTDFEMDIGSAPASVAMEDVNGDGRPDLAIANYERNSASLLFNHAATISAATATGLIIDDDPKMVVSGQGLPIPVGDTTATIVDGTDFGSVELGSGSLHHTFTISNMGNGDLYLSSMPAVSLATNTHQGSPTFEDHTECGHSHDLQPDLRPKGGGQSHRHDQHRQQ